MLINVQRAFFKPSCCFLNTRSFQNVQCFQQPYFIQQTFKRGYATKDSKKPRAESVFQTSDEVRSVVDGFVANTKAPEGHHEILYPKQQKDQVKHNDPPLPNDLYSNQRAQAKPDELDISKIPQHIHDLVDTIAKLNILEVVDLTKLLQEKLGISGMPMMSAPMMPGMMGGVPGAPGAGQAAAPPPEEKKKEKTEWNVRLVKVADGAKYKIIKELRELKPGISLLDTKSMVEKAPSTIAEGVKKEEGERIIQKMKDAGGEAELY